MSTVLPVVNGRRFGRRMPPPLPAHRMIAKPSAAPIPTHKDLRATAGPVKDQGDEGSCTAHAGTSAFEWISRTYFGKNVILSPQSLYVFELLAQGSFPSDVGSDGKTLCEQLIFRGACDLSAWPYVPGQITRPSPAQMANAASHTLGAFHGLVGSKVALSVLGDPVPWPVEMGFTVYESFMSDETAATGIVTIPKKGEAMLGGHEILLLGYDVADTPVIRPTDCPPAALFLNSWGLDWGMSGYGWMPLPILDAVDTDLKIAHSGSPWGVGVSS